MITVSPIFRDNILEEFSLRLIQIIWYLDKHEIRKTVLFDVEKLYCSTVYVCVCVINSPVFKTYAPVNENL